jgi:hypothetical protein
LKIGCVGEGSFVEEFCLSVFDTFSNLSSSQTAPFF